MKYDTSTIKSLDELIIKAIRAVRKSKKRPDEIRIYDSIKIFFENCDIDDSLFWERMKYLEEIEVIYNKPTKMGTEKRGRETVFSPIDQKPAINSPNNSVSTPQDLQDNLSIISSGIDTLDKFIDATLFNITQKSTKEKKSDKQQQTQNTKDDFRNSSRYYLYLKN